MHSDLPSELVLLAAKSDAEFDKRPWESMPRVDRERYMERAEKTLRRLLSERPDLIKIVHYWIKI